jgi:hypothetical protein
LFLIIFNVFKYLKTLKTKRPPDLDTQSQQVHVFKNIKNKYPENDPLFLNVLNVFKYIKT